jgi:S-adenosylmethionine decarboxylase
MCATTLGIAAQEIFPLLRLSAPLFAMRELGCHALVDAWGAEPVLLDDPAGLEKLLVEAVDVARATVITTGSHHFDPQGVTVWAILAEGHATIHTYTEEGRWMADVFTCGDLDPDDATEVLVEGLGGHARISLLSRG